MKQELEKETLEEVAEKLTKDFPHYSVRDNMDDSDIKGWFLEALQKGAKWQQEQDKNKYSDEDMMESFIEGYKQRAEKSDLIFDNASRMYAIALFEQFKNK
jgi:enolase